VREGYNRFSPGGRTIRLWPVPEPPPTCLHHKGIPKTLMHHEPGGGLFRVGRQAMLWVMPSLTIDNQTVDVPDGATILEAAGRLNIKIPTLCHRPGQEPQTSCFVCVVKVAGQSGLAPACATRAVEGMAVDAGSEEVRQARRTALELLLSDHVGDCVAPCRRVHPGKVDVPRVLRLVKEGKWEEAGRVLGGGRLTAENAESAENGKRERK